MSCWVPVRAENTVLRSPEAQRKRRDLRALLRVLGVRDPQLEQCRD
jgi:hypothetical protein